MHQPSIQMTPASTNGIVDVECPGARITVELDDEQRTAEERYRERAGVAELAAVQKRGAVPAKNTNAGAQKCVTQRVKKTPAVGPPAGMPE